MHANRLDLDFSSLPDGTHRRALHDGRRVFAKVQRGMPADFFAADACGLSELAQAGALRVPEVFAVDAIGIALEDLGSGHASVRDWEDAGLRLAALHRQTGARFGFHADGFCGNSAQDNTPDDDGFRFFAERRLLPQMRCAFDAGALEANDRSRIERICSCLRERLQLRPPVLIHGDLWLGNLHACANRELALIDGGAVHFGWAAADLAMLILFGEPPRSFFAAYESASGCGSGWRADAPLLNLYHLLNHLNLFGSGYLSAVRRVLTQYA
jgi:fructosamine-3-kinase